MRFSANFLSTIGSPHLFKDSLHSSEIAVFVENLVRALENSLTVPALAIKPSLKLISQNLSVTVSKYFLPFVPFNFILFVVESRL